ncbi:MAG: pyruvate dehydrogenase (acetyl-transferring) E1 component subunit alpha [Acidobacteriota bacterium]
MPRNKIDLSLQFESLSILDPEGRLDKALEPKIPESRLLEMYRLMLLTREFDSRMVLLQRQGRLGTFPPCRGQEAGHIAAFLLQEKDWLVPSFREPGAMLVRGWTMERILLYYAGYEEGSAPPPGVNALPICVPVGSQLPHAVGLALASKLKGTDQVTLCFLGDGATSEGDFHEAMNFAAVFQVPAVFFCQNNHWAISLPVERQTHSRTLVQKMGAYEIPGIQIDGNDALAVYSATEEAVERARKGEGPSFIESLTYRLTVHTTADDPNRYRSEKEVQEWEKRDPLPRFRRYLEGKGLIDDRHHDRLEEDIRQEIRQAVGNAESRMKGNPLDLFDNVYAEMPPSILEQRQELEEFLRSSEEVAATQS